MPAPFPETLPTENDTLNNPKFTASRLFCLCAIAAICLSTLTPARALANLAVPQPFDAGGKLNSTRIEYNVVEGGRKGMRMFFDFEVTGLKGVDSKLTVRVQHEDEYLKSSSTFAGKDGDVEVSYSMTPGYETAVYDEVPLFLPYSELALDDGEWDLKLDIDLAYEDGGLVAHLGYKEFVFKTPGSARDISVEAKGEVKKVWLEQNVTEKGRRGMRLHMNIEVAGLKDTDAKILVRIMRPNDTFLIGGPKLSNGDGQFEIAYEIKPNYDPAVFDDATLFIPYDEVVVRKGLWRLKFDIDLNNADGSLIQHLTFHDFTLNK